MNDVQLLVGDALHAHVPLRLDRQPAWNDVLARAEAASARRGRPARLWSSRRHRFRLAVVLALVILLLAGVATATYLILRGPGRLTVIAPHGRVASIVGLDSHGRPTLWRCPRDVFCGNLASVSCAPDGRTVAFTVIFCLLSPRTRGEVGAGRAGGQLSATWAFGGDAPGGTTLNRPRGSW